MLEPLARRLHEVTVRPTVGTSERNRWDALMGAHHYLAFRGLVGRSVRHVAVLGEHWLALIGWHAGAFKLQARDRWIGWLKCANRIRPSDPDPDPRIVRIGDLSDGPSHSGTRSTVRSCRSNSIGRNTTQSGNKISLGCRPLRPSGG